MTQISKQLPIKEYDTSLERLEKENFDLKLQISHLQSKLNELTNSSLTLMQACDCKKTKTETKGVLNEVKTEVENLLKINQEIRNENIDLKNKIEEVFEENQSVRKDCIRLSQHITEKTRQEEEYKKILRQMKEEIESVKEEMEEIERIKTEKTHLEEEYRKITEIAKNMEKTFKKEIEDMQSINTKTYQRKEQVKKINQELEQQIEEYVRNNHQLTNENHQLNMKNQQLSQKITNLSSLINNLQEKDSRQTQEIHRTKELGERLVNEMKIKNKEIQLEKEEIEKRAEQIIKDRETKIGQMQVYINKIQTNTQHSAIEIHRAKETAAIYINRIETLAEKVTKIYTEIDKAKIRSKNILDWYKSQVSFLSTDKTKDTLEKIQKEKDRLEFIVKESKQEIEKIRSEKERLSEEREDLAKRLHITPAALRIARDLGINEFTTINNLFITWKETHDKLSRETAQIKQTHQLEEKERSKKLEEFQTKLHAALSELHFCRAYLEEKKSIIKSIKKQTNSNSIFKKIDISH